MLVTVITIAIVHSFARLRILVMVMAGCFGYFVLKAVPFIILTGGNFRIYGPEYSMISDNNDFGLALNMTLPFFFFLAQTESRRWLRWLCAGLFVFTIPAIFFTYSRGALVGLVVVLTLMFFQLKQRLVLIPVIALGIAIALLLAPAAWRARMDPTVQNAMDTSARERLNAWAFSRNLASDFPIAGGGFATFTPELFDMYAPNATYVKGPHSVYFQVLAEHGFVGLFLYLALVLTCFGSAHRLIKMARSHGDLEVVHYTNMLRFSMVGFLASGTFLGRAYFDYFFMIVACLIILERVAAEEWQAAFLAETEGVDQLASGESLTATGRAML
jgi:putative inorganic carbon (hco3(-)) transporter